MSIFDGYSAKFFTQVRVLGKRQKPVLRCFVMLCGVLFFSAMYSATLAANQTPKFNRSASDSNLAIALFCSAL